MTNPPSHKPGLKESAGSRISQVLSVENTYTTDSNLLEQHIPQLNEGYEYHQLNKSSNDFLEMKEHSAVQKQIDNILFYLAKPDSPYLPNSALSMLLTVKFLRL